MTALFQNVLTASFHGSIVILAVLLLRLLLKKTPKKFLCLLWLLAGIRLLMPFEIRSGLSLQPEEVPFRESAIVEQVAEPVPEATMAAPVEIPQAPVEMQEISTPEAVRESPAVTGAYTPEPVTAERDPLEMLDAIAASIWLAVAVCFGLYTLVSYLRLKLQVREAVRIKGNVWECDRIETAFILGFIRPQIYLPMGMSRSNRKHILAHEQTHLEKGDHWFKMIGFIALALHWFNPLVWVAYVLLCKDIEMACDERVVQFMELEERKSYSAALINCSTNHAHFAACPVAFGEVSVKNRVMRVLNYKKPSFWISLAGVIAIGFVAVCLVTSPVEQPEVLSDATEETLPPRELVNVETVDELIAAIGPDREIVLEPGTYNLSQAVTYGGDANNEFVDWAAVSDGFQLNLVGVENLSIRGSGMHVTLIETDPRYADVIGLQQCSGVELSGFTAGHTRYRGECGGGVISLGQCSDVAMDGLGLYGCGMVGLETENSTGITLTGSDIYECSFKAVDLGRSEDVTISGCRIYGIGQEEYGGYVYFELQGCRDVLIENNEITDSQLSHLLCSYSSGVTLKNNRISGNRFTQSFMDVQYDGTEQKPDGEELDVILDNNKLTDNIIRKWHAYFEAEVTDGKGRLWTEAALTEEYGLSAEELADPQQPQLQIHVSTVDELIAAIGPDTEIILDAALYDLSTATGYGTSKGEYYCWEDIFDGPGLVIQNVSNMTIRSADGNPKAHTIAAVPRYADVLAFEACSNITVSGFTAGHTEEPGSCTGGVLEFRDNDYITVDNCGLFGCGILGVQTESCSNVTVKNCDIYECSDGGIRMWDTYGVVVENTTFRDIGGRYIMQFQGCQDVVVDGQQQLAADGYGTCNISTPEQEDLYSLEYVALDFVDHFQCNETEAMADHLADSYTGQVRGWGGEGYAETSGVDVTEAHVIMVRDKGSARFTVKVWAYDGIEERDVGDLTFTVIRENGEYKVGDYILTPAR